jgi:ketosteroid isomerase-like protein
MYKAAVRWMIRRNIASINAGDYRPALAMFSDDIEFSFPGDNSWADEFRPVQRGREVHVTHRGKAEVERFLQRYVAAGLQMEVEDILVNGPPWNLRAAVRVYDFSPGESGDRYNNRAVLFVTARTTRTPSGQRPSTPCSTALPRSPNRPPRPRKLAVHAQSQPCSGHRSGVRILRPITPASAVIERRVDGVRDLSGNSGPVAWRDRSGNRGVSRTARGRARFGARPADPQLPAPEAAGNPVPGGRSERRIGGRAVTTSAPSRRRYPEAPVRRSEACR